MVATVAVRSDTGGTDNTPGATATVTAVRYKEADNDTVDLINPVTIPPSGTKWTFWKHNYLEVTAAGGFTQIDNINWFITSFAWTGTTLWIDDNQALLVHSSVDDTGYDVADGLNDLNTHTHITTPVDAGTTYTNSGSGKAIDIDESGGVMNVVNEMTNYWVTAAELTTSAVAGIQATTTITIEYDEI